LLVAYFDEVKYQKGRSPFYWLCAVIASPELIWKLEDALNGVAEMVFGTRNLNHDTEFHAADILNGHDQFKGWDWAKRIDTLKHLISIFGTAEGLGKVYVKMDVEKMLSNDVEGMAFMFLVERIDGYLHAQHLPGILIGDRENDLVAGLFAENLSRYRTSGTKYQFGKELKHLLDTVHFTHSHHSRMLQLADLHAWLRQLQAAGDFGKWHRKQIIDHVASIDGCLFANKYKEWPTDGAWVKSAAFL